MLFGNICCGVGGKYIEPKNDPPDRDVVDVKISGSSLNRQIPKATKDYFQSRHVCDVHN